jgi:hypothetical protein
MPVWSAGCSGSDDAPRTRVSSGDARCSVVENGLWGGGLLGKRDLGLSRGRSVVVRSVVSAPWDLAVAVLCVYGARGRGDTALVAELGGLARNGVRSRVMRRVTR